MNSPKINRSSRQQSITLGAVNKRQSLKRRLQLFLREIELIYFHIHFDVAGRSSQNHVVYSQRRRYLRFQNYLQIILYKYKKKKKNASSVYLLVKGNINILLTHKGNYLWSYHSIPIFSEPKCFYLKKIKIKKIQPCKKTILSIKGSGKITAYVTCNTCNNFPFMFHNCLFYSRPDSKRNIPLSCLASFKIRCHGDTKLIYSFSCS